MSANEHDDNQPDTEDVIERTRAEKAERELSAISEAIGSVRFMDPPDGGDVSLAEQVSRMRTALERAERERDEARASLSAARSVGRIAKDERDALREARADERAKIVATLRAEADRWRWPATAIAASNRRCDRARREGWVRPRT